MDDNELNALFGISPTSTATPQAAEEPTTTEPSITDSIRSGLDAAVKSIGEMMGADPRVRTH